MKDPTYVAAQQALAAFGFYKSSIDGIPGVGTRAAIRKAQQSWALPDSQGVLNAITLKRLNVPMPAIINPPWVAIILAKKGLREDADKAALEAFLKSDGHTLGDPRVWPWCGDLEETAMLNAGFGPVPANPYLARNWLTFGVQRECYGAVAVFGRPGPKGNEGHVGNVVAKSPDSKRLKVLGGNEHNMIDTTWLLAERLLGYRMPGAWPGPVFPIPVENPSGKVSTNEA